MKSNEMDEGITDDDSTGHEVPVVHLNMQQLQQLGLLDEQCGEAGDSQGVIVMVVDEEDTLGEAGNMAIVHSDEHFTELLDGMEYSQTASVHIGHGAPSDGHQQIMLIKAENSPEHIQSAEQQYKMLSEMGTEKDTKPSLFQDQIKPDVTCDDTTGNNLQEMSGNQIISSDNSAYVTRYNFDRKCEEHAIVASQTNIHENNLTRNKTWPMEPCFMKIEAEDEPNPKLPPQIHVQVSDENLCESRGAENCTKKKKVPTGPMQAKFNDAIQFFDTCDAQESMDEYVQASENNRFASDAFARLMSTHLAALKQFPQNYKPVAVTFKESKNSTPVTISPSEPSEEIFSTVNIGSSDTTETWKQPPILDVNIKVSSREIANCLQNVKIDFKFTCKQCKFTTADLHDMVAHEKMCVPKKVDVGTPDIREEDVHIVSYGDEIARLTCMTDDTEDAGNVGDKEPACSIEEIGNQDVDETDHRLEGLCPVNQWETVVITSDVPQEVKEDVICAMNHKWKRKEDHCYAVGNANNGMKTESKMEAETSVIQDDTETNITVEEIPQLQPEMMEKYKFVTRASPFTVPRRFCEHCTSTVFYSDVELLLHQRCHGNSSKTKLHCALCRQLEEDNQIKPKKLLDYNWNRLKLHLHKYHKVDFDLVCEICSDTFADHPNFHGHRSAHMVNCWIEDCKFSSFIEQDVHIHAMCHETNSKSFRCCVCKYVVKHRPTKWHLMHEHLVMQHPGMIQPLYSCEFCDKGFQELRKHQIHSLHCSGAPKVKCSHCHKFIFESRMAEHTQKHLMQEVVSGMVQMSSGNISDKNKDETVTEEESKSINTTENVTTESIIDANSECIADENLHVVDGTENNIKSQTSEDKIRDVQKDELPVARGKRERHKSRKLLESEENYNIKKKSVNAKEDKNAVKTNQSVEEQHLPEDGVSEDIFVDSDCNEPVNKKHRTKSNVMKKGDTEEKIKKKKVPTATLR